MDVQRRNAHRSKRRRVYAVVVFGVGFVALLVLGVRLASRPPAIERDNLWSGTVTRGELVHEISARGTLVAPELRAVTNRSEGVVEVIRVLPGHVVRAADVLVEMSSPRLEEDLANARWDLEYAEAEERLLEVELENRYLDLVATVANAEAEYITARLEFEAQQELGERQIASALEVERSRLRTSQWLKRLQAEQARLDRFDDYRNAQQGATRARLSQLREQVARLESRISGLKVRAGVPGVVQEVNVEEGQRLGQGEAVVRIVNPKQLIARVRVAERDAKDVEIGLAVRLEIGADTVTGSVTRVDPTVRDRLVTVDVTFGVKERAALRPDLSVTARIELARLEGVLILDRPVSLRPDMESIELFRLEEDGTTAERVNVDIGRMSVREVEVVRGLDVGDRVILSDLSDWSGEPRIRIR